jgi:uncharacterized membrane protein
VATPVETYRASASVDKTSLPAPVSLTQRVDRALRYAVPVATGLVAVGVVLRFLAPSQLWLDEALSVNIAKLPLGKIPGALRHDGAPPLYYVVLHFWMLAFGEGNFAVRALSGLISVATLPLAWVAGKRLGGRRMAWASLLLIASSPFAINYATAARMYSLMILWSLLGFLALARALERPTPRRLACVGALTAVVLYTHYWGIYLVSVVGLWLLLRSRRSGGGWGRRQSLSAHSPRATHSAGSGDPSESPTAPTTTSATPETAVTEAAEVIVAREAALAGDAGLAPADASLAPDGLAPAGAGLAPADAGPASGDTALAGRAAIASRATMNAAVEDDSETARSASWSCFVAMALGSAAFLPWLPSFVFQTLHTGTPWSNAAGLGDILTVLSQYAGGGPWGAALALSLFTLVLLGVFGETVDGHRVLISLQASRKSRPIAIVFMGTLVLAVACGAVAQAAFVGRYTAAVFPLFVLLAGLGATKFTDRRVLAAVLAWTTFAGLVVGIGANLSQRTEAGRVASVINKEASPNDVVLYCPDQLGPAVARLLSATVQQYTFPRAAQPQRINWVDYRQAIHAANVQQFAEQILTLAAGHDIWFVQNPNYPGTEHKCSLLMDWLSAKRNSQVWVTANAGTYSEYESLTRFPE